MDGVCYGSVLSATHAHCTPHTVHSGHRRSLYIPYLVFNNPQKHPQFLSQYRKLRAAKQNETGILVNSFVKTFCIVPCQSISFISL